MPSRLESLPAEILDIILTHTLVPQGRPPFSPGPYTGNGKPVLSRPMKDEEGLWPNGLSLLAVNRALAHLAAKLLFGQNTWRLDVPADNKMDIAKCFWQRYGKYCKHINMAFWPYILRNPRETHECRQDPPCEWWHWTDYEKETGRLYPDMEYGYRSWSWQFRVLHEDILPKTTLHHLELDLRDLHWYGQWPHWWGQWPKPQRCGQDVSDMIWHRRCYVLKNMAHFLLGNGRLSFDSLEYAAVEDMYYIYDRHIDPEYKNVYFENPESVWNREISEILVWEGSIPGSCMAGGNIPGHVHKMRLRGFLAVDELESFCRKAEEFGGRLVHHEHSWIGSLILALRALCVM